MIYDRFQLEAMEYIKKGHSVIVSAPTGSGKTIIAEHVIESCLQKNTAVIYTAPIKALSNQKFRDFQKHYGNRIGILTGDVSINMDAPVLIMTTEIFRNRILEDPAGLNRYSWIIFDEVHYIDDPERGTVWEESLIFLPDHMNILCLSATIPNIHQFAKWIGTIHKKELKVVVEDKRPVPLHFFFQYQNRVTDYLHQLKRTHDHHPNKMDALIKHIQAKDGLPCIYFVFGRRRAEYLASELLGYNFLTSAERDKILSLYKELCDRYDLTNEKSALSMYSLVEKGIAYHHAGMLPTLKETIEQLFTSKLLKVIFTTETFALGINMPARSIIFDELVKYYGRYSRALKGRDFYQMAGRAGRRGIDTEGFVYSRVNLRRMTVDDIERVIYGRPEDVKSQFNASYATILNMYEKYKEELFKIYPLSFHNFETKVYRRKEALRLMDSKLKLLKDLKHIRDGSLTDKGRFAKSIYGYELLTAELYEGGILEGLDEIALGILAVAIAFEPRKGFSSCPLSNKAERLKVFCDTLHNMIRHKESRNGIYPLSGLAHFNLSKSVEHWMYKAEFSKILRFCYADEGELIRYFRMGIQILREMRDAEVSHLLKDKINRAIQMINRDIVDAEKELRER